ncbi:MULTISPECIES: hypothetical protein [Chryseobacterium]|uniref:Uncharacterized protein n=1 Tax=Chryseobacterium camelliae TaxID=1265445 RepID=A0ABU0TLD8_9FLAO|nr:MULTISPECIES: hypothetical protein [Chryseobacterium]MDT3408292.1 hypothetical protein [Pseudacidovorax intermedius]MDQ1097852.1 hypothetical protein [Chryseobacterium camelliae]MDQ1101786.1 hypothetical protein [Chryseobacterium sp. SORGH_AS_1048]MDR6085225.1 hypothetical protein [Chryseobacterium sp. SORGH_AS_0909]MDR6129583.1 hypothetical protein [Chryseobacterium sp. SORGH_AS_1175]
MKNIVLVLMLIPYAYFSQEKTLQDLRRSYCIKDCNKFQIEQNWIKQNNPPPLPKVGVYPKLKRIFNIQFNDRMKLYPFNKYDSIYVVNPVYVKNVNEPRNYIDEKYHNVKRLLSKTERDRLSDILFNHYYLNSFGAVTSFHEDIGCDCIQFEYPKIIFLFKKNGKFEKYMAFPDNGLNRYNFSNDEWNYIDWSMEKENLILKMFKKDILPDENCKGKVYTPPPSPNK